MPSAGNCALYVASKVTYILLPHGAARSVSCSVRLLTWCHSTPKRWERSETYGSRGLSDRERRQEINSQRHCMHARFTFFECKTAYPHKVIPRYTTLLRFSLRQLWCCNIININCFFFFNFFFLFLNEVTSYKL